MTNEEKSNELVQLNKFGTSISPIINDRMYDVAMQMAAWKDQQFELEKQSLINKACKILYMTGYFAWQSEDEGLSEAVFASQFKNAMKDLNEDFGC